MLSPLAWTESLLASAISNGAVLAHPGHGTIPAESPLHYAVEPIHAWWGVLLLAIVAATAAYLRHRQTQKHLQTAKLKRDTSSNVR